jgi:murein DD-endopeptidase MepM/ murein hydrolase activator NlpD
LTLTNATLGRRSTLSAALGRLGMSSSEIHAGVVALAEQLDLRRLPAQAGITVGRDAAGAVRLIGVRAERDRFVRLSVPNGSDAPTVEVVTLPIVSRVTTVGGRVSSSVGQALEDSPYPAQLTVAFADIFQWDIDLLIEPRPGDTVRIVLETHESGPPPADLPPFDGRVEREGDRLRIGKILAASYDGRIANANAYWVGHPDGAGAYYDDDGAPLQKAFLKSPLNYRRISSRFSSGRRHPITRKVVPHHGVDFAAASGTPVVASADGRVASAGWDGPLGRAVRVRHGSEYVTVYGHLRSFAKGIRTGVEVRQNEVIGYVGSTGRATGPHLHYTLIERGRPIDPMRFDNPPTEPLPVELTPRLERAKRVLGPLLASIPLASEPIADLGERPRRPGA